MSVFATDTSRAGVIGLGNLGFPMARRLIATGWNIRVFDPDTRKSDALRTLRCEVAETVEALRDCDVLILAVPGDEAVESILLGQFGYLENAPQPSLVLVNSTVLPGTAHKVAEAASNAGVLLLDAPVSGGSERALNGDLTAFVGAEQEALKAARYVLDALASTVVEVGLPGAGAATKLANQLMVFSTLGGVHEAMRVAELYGVEERTVLEAVQTSIASSWVTENWGFFDQAEESYNEGGTPPQHRPWVKDVDEALQVAGSHGLELPIAETLKNVLGSYVGKHAEDRSM